MAEFLRLARMTDKQPNALALADALETFHNPHDKQAAAELRRLYFENEKLRAALAEQPAEQQAARAQIEKDTALLRQALEALETVLSDAYHRRFPECCGRPGSECCGNPNEAWTPEDNKIMDLLSPVQRQLSDALRAALAEQPSPPAATSQQQSHSGRYQPNRNVQPPPYQIVTEGYDPRIVGSGRGTPWWCC